MTQIPPSHIPFGADSQQPSHSNLRPHRASLLLAIACGGFVLCAPIGIIAWPMASADLRAMDQGLMDSSGRQHTKWCKWIGIANVVQAVLLIVAVPLFCVYFLGVLEDLAKV